jgi:hypothetical protein
MLFQLKLRIIPRLANSKPTQTSTELLSIMQTAAVSQQELSSPTCVTRRLQQVITF